MDTLNDKVAIVTGSGRGIGRCLAMKLARHGVVVAINDIDEEPVEETVAAVRAAGGEAVGLVGDLTDAEFVAGMVDDVVAHCGGLDIIINNAGFTWDNVIQKMSLEQFDAMLDIHLRAPFLLLQAAFPHIKRLATAEREQGIERFRKVVNISSVSGVKGNPGQVNYSTAKAGVIGMTKTLAREWGRYRVNVNAVGFGLIHTRLTVANTTSDSHIQVGERRVQVGVRQERLEAASRIQALGRGGTAEEAANAVYLLCTPESNYITGQLLLCDGGS